MVARIVTPLVLWIEGNPVPKGRPRSGKGNTYTPKKTREAEDAIRWKLKEASVPKFEGTLKIEFHFHRADKRLCDIDNLQKLALDAMQGFVFTNDSQILELHSVLERGSNEPGTWVKVSSLEEGKEGAA